MEEIVGVNRNIFLFLYQTLLKITIRSFPRASTYLRSMHVKRVPTFDFSWQDLRP